jgi:hypothetical protein
MNHRGIDAQLAQSLEEERDFGRLFVGSVADPHNRAVITPGLELVRAFGPCGHRPQRQQPRNPSPTETANLPRAHGY